VLVPPLLVLCSPFTQLQTTVAVVVAVPAAPCTCVAIVDEAELEEAAAARKAAAERAAAAAAGPTRVVHLTRPPAMEEARRQLPIIGLEQEIMEGINHNDVVVSACFVATCHWAALISWPGFGLHFSYYMAEPGQSGMA
jgi:hypothetical protein